MATVAGESLLMYVCFVPGNGARKLVGEPWRETRWETPRGRFDEYSSKFSLSMKPRLNRPVGGRNHFWRLLLADFGRAHYRCQQQRGTCTQHNQTTLPQRNSEVVNLTGLAENKGLDVWCKATVPENLCWRAVWKMMFACREWKRTVLAVNERKQCL